MHLSYCQNRFKTVRRKTRTVSVGGIGIGGSNPIRVQSMTTTNTNDIQATVKQAIALAEAGSELIRITAPNVNAAKALGEIRKELKAANIDVPLVADIHFLPQAAMEAVHHVEKVRVNPGNYADKKKFAIKEYTDQQYQEELERLHDAFSPLVLRCKELGKAMRIGTNHGSLSDRIMNRYGDSPLGMVESALEFIRICESHDFREIILSMKASNPKVMIQAYRLAAAKMHEEGMDYPLHLGVTEAGEGEDGRIKSAIGIGSLLQDGLGDTIRVSLTEDPVYEIPVAQELVKRTTELWSPEKIFESDEIDPFSFEKQPIKEISLGSYTINTQTPPLVGVKAEAFVGKDPLAYAIQSAEENLSEKPIEIVVIDVLSRNEIHTIQSTYNSLKETKTLIALNLGDNIEITDLSKADFKNVIICKRFKSSDNKTLTDWLDYCENQGLTLAIDTDSESIKNALSTTLRATHHPFILTTSEKSQRHHSTGNYRALVSAAKKFNIDAPLWIRITHELADTNSDIFSQRLIEASAIAGSLLCDGLGNILTIEIEENIQQATNLAYNILQGARARISKTEFVACPSCGRTLFDLQSTTLKIKEKTGHLKGVTIAVMGCIVNGPGEMADADFGYVGGAPGKVNLYVGKECVQYHIPEEEAVHALISLIKEHNQWVEPPHKIQETAITV